MNEPEITIPFSFGQNNKVPEVTGKDFFAVQAKNISPEDGHFKVLAPLLLLTSPGSVITNFAYSFEPNTRISDLYALGLTGVYKITTSSSTLIFSPTSAEQSKWAVVPWKTQVYFTRPGEPIRKAQGSVAAAFAPNFSNDFISSKYAIAAHDHLFLGNLTVNGNNLSTTVQWSDLYNPENFNVSETSEADSFPLSVNDLEITGLALHQNQVLIFTYNSVWTASYEGLPTVYGFRPLFNGVGASLHYSVVQVQDKVYFLSTSGVYKIDSFQLIQIGTEIWTVLRDDMQGLVDAPASVDERKKLIYWNVGTKTYVYNYEEDRWAVYDFIYCTAVVTFPGQLRSTEVIDNILVSYNSLTPAPTFATGYNTSVISAPQLLARGSSIYQPGSGTVQDHSITLELPPFFLNSMWEEKELLEAKLVYKKVGSPLVSLTTNYRDGISGAPSGNDTKQIESNALFVSEDVFKVRRNRVGKFVGLSINCNNTATDYIKQLIGITLRFTDAKADK